MIFIPSADLATILDKVSKVVVHFRDCIIRFMDTSRLSPANLRKQLSLFTKTESNSLPPNFDAESGHFSQGIPIDEKQPNRFDAEFSLSYKELG